MNTVAFRDFEERDIDFIHRCKNDERINSLIVGDYHPFSYEESAKWVHGCMGEHETYKFWAIATNDDENRIVGWISLSDIDKKNNSACYHGLVIFDPLYRDGAAEIEAYLMILEYAFEYLKLNRLYGTHLQNHLMTKIMADVFFFVEEGYQRQALLKGGKYIDLVSVSILASEYYDHKSKSDYTYNSIMRRLVNEIKNNKKR
jgi:RimJ/RimL family protein N-acetyltransferase